MKIALVGATGLVGSVMIKVMEEFGFTRHTLLPVASEKSLGKKIMFGLNECTVISVEEAIAQAPEIAIFSAGGKTSLKYAPLFAQAGTTVIDNSSAWRMNKEIPLIVPEINADILSSKDKIIANPNCSTIQMVLALAPLHKAYQIKRLVISTYQSVSGTGVQAVQQLNNETSAFVQNQPSTHTKVYPHPIHRNLFPHGGDFLENGTTTEEEKLEKETQKILGDPSLKITSTVVRVPVTGGHSEAVNAEFQHPFEVDDIRRILSATKGIRVIDQPERALYPMPIYSEGKNEVFVGRIRRDHSQENTLNLWIVADNLRKGAATNAIQIAQYLIDHKLV